MQKRTQLIFLTSFWCGLAGTVLGATIHIDTPQSPPTWAVLQCHLLQAHTSACQQFFTKYFDERGYLRCVERWGGDDGPDDAIENLNDWPLLHALGGSDVILKMIRTAWEGHLRQYTEAKTTDVPFARDGMYYKEFPVMMDWLHNGEGLTVFNLLGLSEPNGSEFERRVRRFAGFYMNEDAGAPNYDPHHRIIRSMFNGSRGPLLRKATAVDWAGDSIEVANRFQLRHSETSYEQMLEHFQDYNDIVGDHPQNLAATSLALNAYMISHEPKYKKWLLEYVDAWRERTIENNGIIPSNIGLDGTIGGDANGKWYGGVYGWGFTVAIPGSEQFANRNTVHLGLVGFGNALLLTGDPRYIDVWRTMMDRINDQATTLDGKTVYPTMHGDDGWYGWQETPWRHGAREIYYWSMDQRDLARVGNDGWLRFLSGDDPQYPERALQNDFSTIRQRNAAMRNDTTTPDTRLSDDPMPYNPATVRNLCNLMLGALHPGHIGAPLHARLRYFDPDHRRSGIPADVAALVQQLTADQTVVSLVNTNPSESRHMIVQGGAYGEHHCLSVELAGQKFPVESPCFHVRLAPGAGAQLTIRMQRYANQPLLAQPWDRK